jgi:hypothetical protein
VLASQTEWSKANIARFSNFIRAVARITISRGIGRGAALGIVRFRPPAGGEDKLRAALDEQLDPARLDGIISMHLLESDPALSRPITDDPSVPNPGAGDWFVLIDAAGVSAAVAIVNELIGNSAFKPLVISSGTYNLLWDLAKSEIPGC